MEVAALAALFTAFTVTAVVVVALLVELLLVDDFDVVVLVLKAALEMTPAM